MKIKGQLQWTDYLAAQLLHMQASGFVRAVQYGSIALMVLASLTTLFLFFVGQFEGSIIYIFPVFILIIIFPLYRYVFLPNRIEKLFTQQKELSLPFEFEFTEAGMHTSNELGNSTRPWTYFTKWKENKELIMIYHSDVLFNIVPKRFFAEAQQIETLKSFLEKNKVPKAGS
jgi:hypothetical protein